MWPFDTYPHNGNQRMGLLKQNGNARHGYALKFCKCTNQYRCAYCGVDMTHDYYTWLLISLDHVVPKSMAVRLSIPKELYEDAFNKVLACRGCNESHPTFNDEEEQPRDNWTIEKFVQLRNRIFQKRFWEIWKKRIDEMQFFDTNWKHH